MQWNQLKNFDLLMVDKRGHGISGSVNASGNAEMAEDIFIE
jgi:hypothetical protein